MSPATRPPASKKSGRSGNPGSSALPQKRLADGQAEANRAAIGLKIAQKVAAEGMAGFGKIAAIGVVGAGE